MDFDLTEDQRLFRDSVERLLTDEYDFEARKRYLRSAEGWSREVWRQYADMGLFALPFAEADGGLSGGAIETMLIMEAFGRSLALEPFMATVLLAGGLLKAATNESLRSQWIPKIIGGDTLLAFAHAEPSSRYDLAHVATTARRNGSGWLIDGRKRHVLHGDCAAQLVVSARVSGDTGSRDGIGLFLVEASAPGVSRRGYLTQDRQRAAQVNLQSVRVSGEAALGEPGQDFPLIARVIDGAVAGLCAEAVGAMTRALELTVEYLKVRRQFGVTLSTFQALQHRAVDMLVMCEQARSMAMYAAMMSEDPDAAVRSRAMSAAKIQIGRSAKFVSEQAVQLHGGIGVTEECQVSHYFRRLSVIEILFGDSKHHLTALAQAGGLTPD